MNHRTEQQMMDLILGFARRDDRVRAVWLNGSRANPKAPRDQYQDFDIVYAVTDMQPFIDDPGWVDVFGERVIMQTRADQLDSSPPYEDWFNFMMQLLDGNRIDLTLVPVSRMEEALLSDRLCRLLLDKDGTLPALPPPSDEDYWVKPPDEREFNCTCNEFLWVATYVAKGVWRREMAYANAHLAQVVRPMLIKMVEWKIGVEHGFKVDTGKYGKYIERYLYSDQWQLFAASFAGGNYEDMMKGILSMAELFRSCGREVAEALGFTYPEEDDRRVNAYIRSGGRFEKIEELLLRSRAPAAEEEEAGAVVVRQEEPPQFKYRRMREG